MWKKRTTEGNQNTRECSNFSRWKNHITKGIPNTKQCVCLYLIFPGVKNITSPKKSKPNHTLQNGCALRARNLWCRCAIFSCVEISLHRCKWKMFSHGIIIYHNIMYRAILLYGAALGSIARYKSTCLAHARSTLQAMKLMQLAISYARGEATDMVTLSSTFACHIDAHLPVTQLCNNRLSAICNCAKIAMLLTVAL